MGMKTEDFEMGFCCTAKLFSTRIKKRGKRYGLMPLEKEKILRCMGRSLDRGQFRLFRKWKAQVAEKSQKIGQNIAIIARKHLIAMNCKNLNPWVEKILNSICSYNICQGSICNFFFYIFPKYGLNMETILKLCLILNIGILKRERCQPAGALYAGSAADTERGVNNSKKYFKLHQTSLTVLQWNCPFAVVLHALTKAELWLLQLTDFDRLNESDFTMTCKKGGLSKPTQVIWSTMGL